MRSRSVSNIFSFLIDLWFFALRDYGEACVVTFDAFKTFVLAWHTLLLSKLSSFRFPFSLCYLILSFLSNRSISAVVDEAAASSFPANRDVHQGSVLFPTVFLLFISDLLDCSSNSIYSAVDDSTLHSSTLQICLFSFFWSSLFLISLILLWILFWIEFSGGAVSTL